MREAMKRLLAFFFAKAPANTVHFADVPVLLHKCVNEELGAGDASPTPREGGRKRRSISQRASDGRKHFLNLVEKLTTGYLKRHASTGEPKPGLASQQLHSSISLF